MEKEIIPQTEAIIASPEIPLNLFTEKEDYTAIRGADGTIIIEFPKDPALAGPLFKKIHALATDILGCDWEKDKMFQSPSRAYPYLSAEKTTQNISPLILKNGLLAPFATENAQTRAPIGSMTSHWSAVYHRVLVDIDTGAYFHSSLVTEAADSGDKAVNKLTTNGGKLFWLNTFMIADDIDPDAAPVVGYVDDKKPKSNAVKPEAKPASAPTTAPKAVPTASPKAPVAVPKATTTTTTTTPTTAPKAVPTAVPRTNGAPTAVPVAVPKATPVAEPEAEPASEPAPTEVPASEPAPASELKLSMGLQRAVNMILDAHPELEEEAKQFRSVADAQAFVTKY